MRALLENIARGQSDDRRVRVYPRIEFVDDNSIQEIENFSDDDYDKGLDHIFTFTPSVEFVDDNDVKQIDNFTVENDESTHVDSLKRRHHTDVRST